MWKSTYSRWWLSIVGITSIFCFIAVSGIDCRNGNNRHFRTILLLFLSLGCCCCFLFLLCFSLFCSRVGEWSELWRDPIFLRQTIFRVSFLLDFSLALFFFIWVRFFLRCFCSTWNYFYPVFELQLRRNTNEKTKMKKKEKEKRNQLWCVNYRLGEN